VIRSKVFVKQDSTRSFVERKLSTKSKPWVAASLGILDPASSDDVQCDNSDSFEAPAPEEDEQM
jgi:hypothetical protein